jgi:hypothetical protein
LRRRRRESLRDLTFFLGNFLHYERTDVGIPDTFPLEALREYLTRQLLDYGCIPLDAPASCRCCQPEVLVLPQALDCQMLDIAPLLGRTRLTA